jgi:hypothetical protein
MQDTNASVTACYKPIQNEKFLARHFVAYFNQIRQLKLTDQASSVGNTRRFLLMSVRTPTTLTEALFVVTLVPPSNFEIVAQLDHDRLLSHSLQLVFY